ncbi:MAG: hypothetical protein RR800_00620, partial [Comamonas sp.]
MAQVLENNVMGVLSGAVDAVTKNLPLVSLVGWPVLAGGDYCLATLIGLNVNGVEASWEIVKVTGRVGSSLTVDRGQEGIAARAWPAGTVLQMRLTAGSVATPSLVDAVRLGLVALIGEYKTAVDGQLSNKVDKNGAKVLSDNNFTNEQMVKLANIATGASNDRSKHTGVQPIASISDLEGRLDAALRTRLINAATAKEFLQQMVSLGPGSYRHYTAVGGSIPNIPPDSSGVFSIVADTFSFVVVDYQTGVATTISGNLADIDNGTWKVTTFGNAATRTVQSGQTDNTSGRILAVGAFGMGMPMDMRSAGATSGVGAPNTFFGKGTMHGLAVGSELGVPGATIESLGVLTVHGQWLDDSAKAAIRREFKLQSKTWVSWAAGNTTWTPWVQVNQDIERGSNGNGEYVRFSDGTLICSTIRRSSLYDGNWNFPASFSESPKAVIPIPFSNANGGGQFAVRITQRSPSYCAFEMDYWTG